MDTVICDKTAFNYWRIPPVVQLLACSPEADERLARVLTNHDMEVLSANFVQTQANFKQKHCGNAGQAYKDLMENVPLLALCGSGPFDIMVSYRGQARESCLMRPRIWCEPLGPGCLRPATQTLDVTSPEFTLQQIAAHHNFGHALLAATELCGTFSVYHTPAPIAGIIERLCAANQLPAINGWMPSLDASGKLTDLWTREPLITPTDLRLFAQKSDSARGRKKLERVAGYVVPDAASPFEAEAGALLGLPRRCGGAGLSGLSHNRRIGLTHDAALIAGRSACYCDLYWNEGVDLECHSKAWHSQRDNQLSDFAREAALELMGIDVVPLTHEQMTSARQLDAIVRLVSVKLGREVRPKSQSERRAEAKLREEILSYDW